MEINDDIVLRARAQSYPVVKLNGLSRSVTRIDASENVKCDGQRDVIRDNTSACESLPSYAKCRNNSAQVLNFIRISGIHCSSRSKYF